MLVIDNGPQYDSAELSAFARRWGFEKVTSSPKLPKVSREYPALLEWGRTTTEGFGTIPAQRFMGRCSKTLLPTRNTLLKPKFETREDVQALSKLKSANNGNLMKPIIPCGTVLTKISVKTTWHPCTCTGSLGSRSFMVRVGSRSYRRGTGETSKDQRTAPSESTGCS